MKGNIMSIQENQIAIKSISNNDFEFLENEFQ